jgi:hypothetical protein
MTEEKNKIPIPPEFITIFRELVVATQPRQALDRDTSRVYYETLRGFPIDVLRTSAERLRRTATFFPSTGEWYSEAVECLDIPRLKRIARELRRCDQCGGRGLIRICYESGEQFDIAICDCTNGQSYRGTGEACVRLRLGLAPEHRIGWLEDFEDAA